MPAFRTSMASYERWLARALRGGLVASDIAYKHAQMKTSAFAFLRATYWRWAETILDVCPSLRDDPQVLSVGDIHLDNFGVWRDADDRLVWGVNDFDEAAVMPFSLDLVRLATSALLLEQRKLPAGEICAAIETGYHYGLQHPLPIVLERDNARLRKVILTGELERKKFWRKISRLKAKTVPPRFARVLRRAMPEPIKALHFAPRLEAGLGGLGRPRWVAFAEWRGGPIAREAKELVASAWHLFHKSSDAKRGWREIAHGPYRSPDGWLDLVDRIVVRRLAPRSRKIELSQGVAQPDVKELLTAMGRELANIHAGTRGAPSRIAAALKHKDRIPLRKLAKTAAAEVSAEWRAYRGKRR